MRNQSTALYGEASLNANYWPSDELLKAVAYRLRGRIGTTYVAHGNALFGIVRELHGRENWAVVANNNEYLAMTSARILISPW